MQAVKDSVGINLVISHSIMKQPFTQRPVVYKRQNLTKIADDD